MDNQEQANTPDKASNLTINDIRMVRNIIDLSSTRGAFKASELKTVGEVFNKLNEFVEFYEKTQKTKEEGEG